MSLEIPVIAEPSQTMSVNLSQQSCLIALRTLGLAEDAHLYFTLTVAGVPVVTNRICRNVQRILEDAGYHGFQGDFMFIDQQGDTDPAYPDLGTRYVLLYLLPAELP